MRVLKLLLSASKDQVTTTLGITKVIKLIFGKVTGRLNRKDARLHLSAHIVGPVAEKLTVVWFSKIKMDSFEIRVRSVSSVTCRADRRAERSRPSACTARWRSLTGDPAWTRSNRPWRPGGWRPGSSPLWWRSRCPLRSYCSQLSCCHTQAGLWIDACYLKSNRHVVARDKPWIEKLLSMKECSSNKVLIVKKS